MVVITALGAFASFFVIWKLVYSCFLKPLKAYYKLKSLGFSGPTPHFPLGNRSEMMMNLDTTSTTLQDVYNSSALITHDVHSTCMPHFVQWQKDHGKVLVFWIGTEPFVYVADVEFLKEMSMAVTTKNWGKPPIFRNDRQNMFGEFGLNMLQGDTWAHHKRVIGPAFTSSRMKLIMNTLVECTKKLTHEWTIQIATSSKIKIDIEKEISYLVAGITAKTHFGVHYKQGIQIYNKVRSMQFILFKNMFKRYIGVPYGQFLCLKETLEATRLGDEIDKLFQSIITVRRKTIDVEVQQDFLGLMLVEGDDHKSRAKALTDREVIDECKTFFFAATESAKLAVAWTLMLLAENKRWQDELRDEIKEVIGDAEINFTMLTHLQKMGWVMNEVLRLYPSSPNVVRYATSDIKVGETIIPEGTNIWVDILGMHHDKDLWGKTADEFNPERFRDDPLHGGCLHKMGYLPFGFGGRMCPGKNYGVMIYKIILCSLLQKFSFSVSPSYRHSPLYFFTLRPSNGMDLIIEHVQN